MRNLNLIRVSLLLAFQAVAQNGVRIGEPTFAGDGCNRRTATASITEDGQTLSILFDKYIVEVGGNLRQRQDRKSCNVNIPVMVPSGYSVAVMKIDYRGFNSLPAGAQSQFNVSYFFHGRIGPKYIQNFQGPLESDFITNNSVQSPDVVWSVCGRQFDLRAHSSMKTTTNQQREQAISTVDSADVQAGLVYQLQWKRCTRDRER